MDNYKNREFIDPSRGFLYVVLAEHEVKENMLGHEEWIAIPDSADCLMHWTSGQKVFYRDKHSEYWNSAYSDWRTVIGYEGIEKMGTLWKRPDQDVALINGPEAWIAISKGHPVQWVSKDFFFWQELDITNLNAKNFLDEDRVKESGFKYRLKPQTIKLELELPKPFEPKEGDLYWFITCRTEKGYSCRNHKARHGDYGMQYGAYRTEDEIKQVVEQLRKIRGAS